MSQKTLVNQMSHKVLLKLKQNRFVTRKCQLLELNRKLITLTTLKRKRKWLMSKSRKETIVAGDEVGTANSLTVSTEVIGVATGADEVAIITISITLETIRTLMPIKVVLSVAAIVAGEVSNKMVKTNSTIIEAMIGVAIEEKEMTKTTSFTATIGAKAIKMQTASRKSRNSQNTEAGEATTRNSTNTTQASTTANRVKTTKVATVVGVIATANTQGLIKWKIWVDRRSKATTSIKSD